MKTHALRVAVTAGLLASSGCIEDPDAEASGVGARTGVRHDLCGNGMPIPPPPVPLVRSDPSGRPNFDLWRDLPCEEDTPLCTPGDGCPSCLRGQEAAPSGVCAKYGDIDASCDGEGEVLSHFDQKCWICAPIVTHARACCAGLPGFDCRVWPYPGDGKPGMVCARHEDCEPGLVCGAGYLDPRVCGEDDGACHVAQARGGGYGLCQCPGIGVQQPGICDQYWR